MRADKSRHDELVKLLDDRVGIHQHARPERLGIEQQWITANLYFKGLQRIEWVDGRVLNRGYTDDDEARYKVNLLAARLIAAASRVLSQNGEFDVRPPRGDMRSRELAALSKRLFDHIKDVTDFEWQSIQSTISKALYGTNVYKTIWDPFIGDPSRYFLNDKKSKAIIPESMLTDDQIGEKLTEGLYEDRSPGDIRIDPLSPFTCFPDWSARGTGIRNCKWFAEKHYVDIDVIAERFNKDPKDIRATEISQGLMNYEDAMQAASGGSWMPPFAVSIPKDKQHKRCLYIEYWARPSKLLPKGLRLCFAGDRILNDDNIDNPYAADKTGWSHLPFSPDYWIPDPSRFWGKSLAEDMLTPQFYLNEMRSQKMMFARIFGLPNTYVGKNSTLDTDNMEAGGRIYGVDETSNYKVQHGPAPQMPAEVAILDSEIIGDLNAVSSSSEIEGDKMPGQLRSGAAISQMNQDRFMGLSIPARCSLRAARDVGRQSLAIYKLFGGPNRTMQYLGEGNEWIVEEFASANLLTDVVITSQPGFITSADESAQKMMDAVSAGAFNPLFDLETKTLIWSAMEFRTGDEFVKQRLAAKRACEREIQTIMKDPAKYAQGFKALDWQDHEIYMATLKAFFYTPEFDKLDTFTKASFNELYAQHKALLMQEQMVRAQAVEATKGAPGQPGMASQPRS